MGGVCVCVCILIITVCQDDNGAQSSVSDKVIANNYYMWYMVHTRYLGTQRIQQYLAQGKVKKGFTKRYPLSYNLKNK